MKTLNCDICRKVLEKPIKERNYWHIKEYDICENCKDALEIKLRKILRSRYPFSHDWYENEYIGLIQKGIAARCP